MITIHLVDPRARLREGFELGTLRTVVRGDPRRPWPALVIAKPRGGTARTRRRVAR